MSLVNMINSANFLNKYFGVKVGFAGDHYQGAEELSVKLAGSIKLRLKLARLCDEEAIAI